MALLPNPHFAPDFRSKNKTLGAEATLGAKPPSDETEFMIIRWVEFIAAKTQKNERKDRDYGE